MEGAALGEAVPRLGEQRAADRVQDEVEPGLRPGQAGQDLVGAQCAESGGPVRRPHECRHPGARQRRQLDGETPHAAAGAGDQDVARQQGPGAQHPQRGDPGDPRRGTVGQLHALGDGGERGGIDRHPLRPRVGRHAEGDARALGRPRAVGRGAYHDAGRVVAVHGTGRPLVHVVQLSEVETDVPYRDQRLVAGGHGLVDLGEPDGSGRAVLDHKGAHGGVSFFRVLSRSFTGLPPYRRHPETLPAGPARRPSPPEPNS